MAPLTLSNRQPHAITDQSHSPSVKQVWNKYNPALSKLNCTNGLMHTLKHKILSISSSSPLTVQYIQAKRLKSLTLKVCKIRQGFIVPRLNGTKPNSVLASVILHSYDKSQYMYLLIYYIYRYWRLRVRLNNWAFCMFIKIIL